MVDSIYGGGYTSKFFSRSDCLPSTCGYVGAASFDVNGDILTPNSGDYRYWDVAPSSINPVPCAYNITVGGIENYDIGGSWCQQCNIDSNHVSNYYGASERFITLTFCSEQKPLNQGYSKAECVFLIAEEATNPASNSFPSGDGYLYQYKNRELENRPLLYVWVITKLSVDQTQQAFDEYVQSTLGEDTNNIYFKTKIGEFKGDYKQNYYTIAPYVYTNSCQNPKPYNGDLDMRSLSFNVKGSDLWPYKESPRGTYTNRVDAVTICDVSNFIMSVSKYENSNTLTSSITDYGLSFQAQQGTCVDDLYVQDVHIDCDGIAGGKWMDVSMYASGMYGPISENIYVTVGGIESVQKDLPIASSTRETCYDSSNINGEHVLNINQSFFSNRVNLWGDVDNPPDFWSFKSWTSDIDDICCDCNGVQDGCVTQISASLYSHYNYRMNDGKLETSSQLQVGIAGNIYKYDFENWGSHSFYKDGITTFFSGSGYILPAPVDFNGQSVELEPHYEDPSNSGIHDFSSANISATFGSVNTLACLDDVTTCITFNDSMGPKNIIVNIPNDWQNPDDRQSGYSTCFSSSDSCRYIEEFKCCNNSITNYVIESGCMWQPVLPIDTDCVYGPPDSNCWNGGLPKPAPCSTDPLDWCAGELAVGEYVLEQIEGGPHYINPCTWVYNDGGETPIGRGGIYNSVEYCPGAVLSLTISSKQNEVGVYIVSFYMAPGVTFEAEITSYPGSEILDEDGVQTRYYIDVDKIDGLVLDFVSTTDTPVKWGGSSVTLSVL